MIELDLALLARRLGERGVIVAPDVLQMALPAAWAHYDERVHAGLGHPWRELMTVLLTGAGVEGARDHAEWLWTEQPTCNLWRSPIDDMVELAQELAAGGATLAVLSNSEGRLAELLAEVGADRPFRAIIDSGRVGFEKPDPRIFAHTLATLGALGAGHAPGSPPPIHIGDSWAADVVGARGVGWRAIWFGRNATPIDDPDIAIAHDAAGVRAAIARWSEP